MKKKKTDRKTVHTAAILTAMVCLFLLGSTLPVRAAQTSEGRNGNLQQEQTGSPAAGVSGNEIPSGSDPASAAGGGNTVPSVQNWNITATPVSYGQQLKDSVLEGKPVDAAGMPVRGSFSWKDPEKVMTAVGEVSTVVRFTPESLTADGQLQYGQPCEISFWIRVEPATPVVSEWCKVKCRDTVYDGDILAEVTKLEGGRAVCEIAAAGKRTRMQTPVSGKFIWKDGRKKLETGTQRCTLLFVPADETLFKTVSTEVEFEVLPRPVEVLLELSETVIRTGDKLRLTASIPKTEGLSAVSGRIAFSADGAVIGEKALTEGESAWKAEMQWSTENAGTCKLSAQYIPEDTDTHTAPGASLEKEVTVVCPLSGFLTEEQGLADPGTEILLSAREGKSCTIPLKTDASGKFDVRFSLEEGALPKGLTLGRTDGKISGIPAESGTFAFTAAASEKDVTVKQQYRLTVAEKLTFSLRCSDICYGEPLRVQTIADPPEEFLSTCTFEGRGTTVYQRSETPPSLPGSYRVHVRIDAPKDYAGQELFGDFTIKKAVPKLTVAADPGTLKNGGECTLFISLENPHAPDLKDDLPDSISVSFDKEVEIRQPLRGNNGNYKLVFYAKPQNTRIRCSVSIGENSCYESAETYRDIKVTKTEPPKEETGREEKPSSSNEAKEPEKESEPEPVRKTAEEVEAEFWQDVIFRIYQAQEKGEAVTINAKGHGSLPDRVLDALRQHRKVTLALVWEGDMIVIPAGKAVDYDKNHKSWTLAELSKRYPLTQTEPSQPSRPEETPPAIQQPETAPQPVPKPVEKPSTGQNAPAQTGSGKDGQEETAESGMSGETDTAETEPEQGKSGFTEVLRVPETVPAMEEVAEGSTFDLFLAAAGICAVCGIIVTALAITAMVKGKKRNGE